MAIKEFVRCHYKAQLTFPTILYDIVLNILPKIDTVKTVP